MLISKPGIYKGISNEDYHKSKGISSSGISLILDCPKQYWYKYLSGECERKDSDAFLIGSAVHTLALEPETFNDRYLMVPKMDRRTKDGAGLYQSVMMMKGNREILTFEQHALVYEMAKSITERPFFKKNKVGGCIEDSIAWLDGQCGALLRSRPDFYNEKYIIDVKTTRDVRKFSFQRSVIDFGYHRQAAMACDGLTEQMGIPYDKVILCVVSTQAPYLAKEYVLTGSAIDIGRAEYKNGAFTYMDCLTNDYWPGYDEKVEDIDLPGWAYYSEETKENG